MISFISWCKGWPLYGMNNPKLAMLKCVSNKPITSPKIKRSMSYPQETGILQRRGHWGSVLVKAGSESWWLMGRERGKLPPCSASSGPEWNYNTTPGFSSPSSFLRGERNELCSLVCTANTSRFFNSILRMILQCPRDTSHSDTPHESSTPFIWNTLRFLFNVTS